MTTRRPGSGEGGVDHSKPREQEEKPPTFEAVKKDVSQRMRDHFPKGIPHHYEKSVEDKIRNLKIKRINVDDSSGSDDDRKQNIRSIKRESEFWSEIFKMTILLKKDLFSSLGKPKDKFKGDNTEENVNDFLKAIFSDIFEKGEQNFVEKLRELADILKEKWESCNRDAYDKARKFATMTDPDYRGPRPRRFVLDELQEEWNSDVNARKEFAQQRAFVDTLLEKLQSFASEKKS